MSEQSSRPGWTTVGHPAAVRLLSGALKLGRTSHAYLITGPERIGKRTLALDLARAVNCTPATDMFGDAADPPCGVCTQCERIRRGLHADVRVIDIETPVESSQGSAGARTRQSIGIDHVADLQKEAALKPFEGRRRVFIIDGAESMTSEASNRLLKTLEEPAESVVIILVAASSGPLPQTVVSRCQRVRLHLVATELIERMLVERHNADPDIAGMLARIARGRPGWAIGNLDDPTALDSRNQMALRIVSALTGDLEERFRYARDVSNAFRRDRPAAMSEVSAWLEWWRDTAFASQGLDALVVNSDWLATFKALGSQLDLDAIAGSVGAVQRTLDALAANAMPGLALEVMMLDIPQVDPQAVPVPGTESVEAAAGAMAT